MAKEKTSKAVQNKHIYARASYLYQAAAYLSVQSHGNKDSSASVSTPVISKNFETVADNLVEGTSSDTQPPASSTAAPAQISTIYATQPHGSPRHLLTHLRGICLKSQVRLSQDIKRSICKRCNVLLVPGETSVAKVENASRKGRKEWADVYVVRCLGCGGVKRFPVGMVRQKGKSERGEKKGEVEADGKKGEVENKDEGEKKAKGERIWEVEKKSEGKKKSVDEEDGMLVGNEIMHGETGDRRAADERGGTVASKVDKGSRTNIAHKE